MSVYIYIYSLTHSFIQERNYKRVSRHTKGNTYRKLCSCASSHELSKLQVYFPIVCLLLSCSPFFSNLSAPRMEQIKHRGDFLQKLFGSASVLLSMCNPHCVPAYFLIIFSSSMSLLCRGGRTLGQERTMQID